MMQFNDYLLSTAARYRQPDAFEKIAQQLVQQPEEWEIPTFNSKAEAWAHLRQDRNNGTRDIRRPKLVERFTPFAAHLVQIKVGGKTFALHATKGWKRVRNAA